MIKDIEGNVLNIGDFVYYARKHDYKANGELVKCIITDIKNNTVIMGRYTATGPDKQLVKIKK